MPHEAAKDAINGALIDRFTFVHAAAGYLFSRTSITEQEALFLAIGWEILEDKLKRAYPHLFPNPSLDTKQNALTDVGAFMLVFNASRGYDRKRL